MNRQSRHFSVLVVGNEDGPVPRPWNHIQNAVGPRARESGLDEGAIGEVGEENGDGGRLLVVVGVGESPTQLDFVGREVLRLHLCGLHWRNWGERRDGEDRKWGRKKRLTVRVKRYR